MTTETALKMHQMWIGGEWRGATGGRTRPVLNPTTGEAFAEVPEATREDAAAALEAAHKAQPAWEALPTVQRAAYLRKIAALVRENTEELARLVTQEEGKPITEARGELGGTAEFFDYFASFARSAEGEIFPSDNPNEQLWIQKVPFGVVVGIIPWNYPSALFSRKVAPALMAGNTIVIKPSEDTPLSSLAMAKICEQAGLPAGVVNVITGAGTEVGDALVRDERTNLISMTGSVRAGKQIAAAAAENLTVISLELGGKAPFIVMDDVDLDLAVKNAITSRFMNCGQVCICNERTYVHRKVFDEFTERYVKMAQNLVVGDPMLTTTDMGPKVNRVEVDKTREMVDRAIAQGAERVLGETPLSGPQFERGFWSTPTVLTNVRNDMDIMQQEIFGPVTPLMVFDDFEEALSLANDTKYGLSSYLFTKDLSLVMRAARALRFGELYVNRIGPELVQGFHGGYGISGIGGDDGTHGLEKYSRQKTVYVNYGDQAAAHLMPYGR